MTSPKIDRPMTTSLKQRFDVPALAFTLLVANVLAWSWAWRMLADQPAAFGVALMAYLFGVRHAFDIDHVAAIDNVVRKLHAQNQRPYDVGFFFALGHSTLVIIAVVLIAMTTSHLWDTRSAFMAWSGIIATTTSSTFLLVISIINLMVLKNLWVSFKHTLLGHDPLELDALLAERGALARIARPLFRLINRSSQMFFVGILFGLGFDTATEIALFSVSATQAAHGSSLSTVLVFPVLFAAGMTLADTADSLLMVRAYDWALTHPLRKIWYNLTLTILSIVTAVTIGSIEILALLARQWHWTGRIWQAIETLNNSMANYGYMMVGLLLGCWAISWAIYRWRGYDLRHMEGECADENP